MVPLQDFEGRLFGRSLQVVVLLGVTVAFVLQLFWIHDQRKKIDELGKEIHELRTSQSTSAGVPTKTAEASADTHGPGSKEPPPDKSKP
jgi:hypothetical protein